MNTFEDAMCGPDFPLHYQAWYTFDRPETGQIVFDGHVFGISVHLTRSDALLIWRDWHKRIQNKCSDTQSLALLPSPFEYTHQSLTFVRILYPL